MKSPDEIKKGLECCMDYQNCIEGEDPQCPFYDVERCMEALLADALALIQQLEAERDSLIESIKNCTLLSAFPLQCKLCKNVKDAFCGEKCKWCSEFSNFEWRGVQKEATP